MQKGGSSDWTFDIVGIFDVTRRSQPGQRVPVQPQLFRRRRGPSARAWSAGISCKLADPARAVEVSAAIDKPVRQLPRIETKTLTEKENAQSFLKQIGDINFIVDGIVGAVLFTLLFLTGNMMMQSVRERIPEFAVLKTLGFSNGGVLALVLAESLLLCLIAAAVGLAFAMRP